MGRLSLQKLRKLRRRRHSIALQYQIGEELLIRWLAGGSYIDLSFGYDLPSNVIHEYIFEVLQAIDDSVDNIRFSLNS
jgi:hypothetical protein